MAPSRSAPMSERVTVQDFRRDPMFPRIDRAVAAILANGKVVAPVDVLVNMDLLEPSDLEDWRFGRVPRRGIRRHRSITGRHATSRDLRSPRQIRSTAKARAKVPKVLPEGWWVRVRAKEDAARCRTAPSS